MDLVPTDVRVVDLSARRALASLLPLVRYLRRRRPSLLMATLPEANVVAVIGSMLVPVPMPVILRRASNLTMEYASGSTKVRLTLLLEQLLLPRAAAVVVNSPRLSEDLKQRVPLASHLVRVIHNPVVWPDHLQQAALPVDHPWMNQTLMPVVVSVGRLSPPKDHQTLLEAFAQVVKSRPARLVVLGEGPDREELTNLADRLGIGSFVDFVGFRLNPFSYMSRARVVVLSSRYEGLPNVLVQAMACGTQVVSTDCPSGPGEILQDGRLGRLVPVGDSSALAAAIRETLDGPANRAALMARANDYSAESSIAAYIDLITSVTDRYH